MWFLSSISRNEIEVVRQFNRIYTNDNEKMKLYSLPPIRIAASALAAKIYQNANIVYLNRTNNVDARKENNYFPFCLDKY